MKEINQKHYGQELFSPIEPKYRLFWYGVTENAERFIPDDIAVFPRKTYLSPDRSYESLTDVRRENFFERLVFRLKSPDTTSFQLFVATPWMSRCKHLTKTPSMW